MKLAGAWAWAAAIALSCGAASYAATRGPDGSPLLALVLFPAIGIVYGAAMWRSTRLSAGLLAAHLAIMLAATFLPFPVAPRLEEMGGILYYAIPALVCLNSVATAIAVLVVRPRLAQRSAR